MERLRMFLKETTLHGAKFIADRRRPIYERFMWFLCVAFAFGITMFVVLALWEKFQTKATITGLDTDFNTWDVTFPALTLCEHDPSNQRIIDEFIQKNMNNTKRIHETKKLLVNLTHFSYKTLKEIKTNSGLLEDNANLKTLSYQLLSPCYALLAECEFKAEIFNCCDIFNPVFTEVGYCFTFNSPYFDTDIPLSYTLKFFKPEDIRLTDSKWNMKITLARVDPRMKISVFIHDYEEPVGIDLKPQHVWDSRVDSIIFSPKSTYTEAMARQLSIRQRNCVFHDEIVLKSSMLYTYTACMQECRMDAALGLCSCIPHFYPENGDKHYVHCNLKQLSCIIENIKAIVDPKGCGCMLGCSNTVYEVEKHNEYSPFETVVGFEVEFLSWPSVRYKREIIFGWSDLLVACGGVAGLYTGFSLVSAIEFIYYFTIRVYCMSFKSEERSKKRQKIKNLEDLHVTNANTDGSVMIINILPPFGIEFTN